jgi:hypothetical protein
MAEPLLEEVFKLSGIPTYTFVPPMEYDKLLVALRSPGRGVVIEGPSGIGKTTAVTRALAELGIEGEALKLSARKAEDREIIAELPRMEAIGVVIVDDFHRLGDDVRREVADYLKILADEEAHGSKLIVVGINRAGESLIRFARDLVNRIDTIRFEANPDDRVERMIAQGEGALNISLGIRDDIVKQSSGSFYIAQMLCQETCVAAGITQRTDEARSIDVSYEVVLGHVMDRLGASFLPVAIRFASGTKLRREGRAPYLHILRWLAEADEWSIDLEREAALHPMLKGSVSQVVDKSYLEGVLATYPEVSEVLHFDPDTKVLGAEDPQFVFYIRNIAWKKFAERVGYLNVDFESKYDFALSFAGANRDLAERIADRLKDRELAPFYDKDEEHRILAENIEDYLGPIYRSEATYVVPLLASDYPTRIWTKFESDQFKRRFGEKSVIPVWYSDVPPAAFGEDRNVGGVVFDVSADIDAEAERIAALLAAKMRDRLTEAAVKTDGEDDAADPAQPLFHTP